MTLRKTKGPSTIPAILLYDGCKAKSYMDKMSMGMRAEEADRRNARGEHQTYCGACMFARWPEEQSTCPMFVRSEMLEEFYAKEILK